MEQEQGEFQPVSMEQESNDRRCEVIDPWRYILPVLEGGWARKTDSSTWKPPPKNLLIFVSSTFTDSHLERDVLTQQILPHLQAKAQKHGMLVTLTDMRYGVIEANQRNHRVWEYCKAELIRCHRDSASIFFLSLQGNKYGYCPVPRTIDQTVFEERLRLVVNEFPEALPVLQRWFFLDYNASPPLYTLKYIANKTEDELFWNDQPILHRALAEIAFEPEDPSILVGQSITEWETRFSLQLCNASVDMYRLNKEKIWIERSFPDDQLNIDCDPYMHCADFYFDNSIQQSRNLLQEYMHNQFEHHLKLHCPSVQAYLDYINDAQHIRDLYDTDELGNYAKEWGEKVKTLLEKDLDDAIQRRKSWKSIPGVEHVEEMLHHGEWAIVKAESFVGRENLVSELLDAISLSDLFVSHSKALTCGVIGSSGCGKTALMAKVAQLAYLREINNPSNESSLLEQTTTTATTTTNFIANQLSVNAVASNMTASSINFFVPTAPLVGLVPWQPRPVLIRFCGTSPDSSDAFSLVRSICLQLSLIFNQPSDWHFATSVTDYTAAVQHFQHLLQVNPIILFIDSLDQLSDAYQGRSRLSFLTNFQPHPDTRIIVSSLPDEIDPITKEWVYCYQCESRLKEWQIPILEVHRLGVEITAIRREEVMQRARSDGSHSESVLFADIPHVDDESCWDSDEYEKMLRIILRDKYKRTCSPQQMSYVLRQAAEEPSVLYLQLACRVIANWTSNDFGVELSSGVIALIYQIFSGLEAEYGLIVTRAALGFLTFSKSGVTDNEMQNLLTLHPGVIAEVDAFHTMRRPRLPFHVWARLRSALEGLIVEKQDGCLRWYHRQLQETAERRYSFADTTSRSNFGFLATQGSAVSNANDRISSGKERLELHCTMARFFGNAVEQEEKQLKLISEQPLLWMNQCDATDASNDSWNQQSIKSQSSAYSFIWTSSDDIRINRRRCQEASFHLAASAAWILREHPNAMEAKQLVESMIIDLCHPAYVCACSKVGNLVGYLQDLRNLRTALTSFRQIAMNIRIRLEQYIRWIRMYIGVLVKDPETQIPYSLSEMAEEYTELGIDYEKLLRERANLSILTGPMLLSTTAQQISSVNATTNFSHAGPNESFPTELISNSSQRNEASLLQPNVSGKGWVFPVVWKVERSLVSARPEMTLSGCKEHIMAIAASPTNAQAAVFYQNGIIEIWDIEVGTCGIVMEGASSLHGSWLSYTPDGKKLVSMVVGWFKMGIVEVWDANIGYRLLYHQDVRLSGGLVCTPDCHYIIVGCKDGTTEMWNIRSAACKKIFADSASVVENKSPFPAVSCLAVVPTTAPSSVNSSNHSLMINELAESTSGRYSNNRRNKNGFVLAVGFDDGHITLWDAVHEVKLSVLSGYDQRPIRVICFSHSGRRITSVASQSTSSLAWMDQTSSMSLLRVWCIDEQKIRHMDEEEEVSSELQGDAGSSQSQLEAGYWCHVKRLQEIVIQGTCISATYSATPKDRILVTLENDQIVCRDADTCETINTVAAVQQVNLLCGNLSNGAYVTTTDDGQHIHVWSPDIHLDFDDTFRTPGRVAPLSRSLSRTWSSVSMFHSPPAGTPGASGRGDYSPHLLHQQEVSRSLTLHRKQSEHSLYRYQSEKSLHRLVSERSLHRLSSERMIPRLSSERSLPRLSSERSFQRHGSRAGSFFQRSNNNGGVDLTALDTFTIPEVRDKDGGSLEYISSSDEEEDEDEDDEDAKNFNKNNKGFRGAFSSTYSRTAKSFVNFAGDGEDIYPFRELSEPSKGSESSHETIQHQSKSIQRNMTGRKSSNNLLRYTKSMPAMKDTSSLLKQSMSVRARCDSSTINGGDSLFDLDYASSPSSSARSSLLTKKGLIANHQGSNDNPAVIQDTDDRMDALCIHPDGSYVAVARHKDSHITLWSLDGRILIDVLPDVLPYAKEVIAADMLDDVSDISRSAVSFRVIFMRFLHQGKSLLIGLQCGLFAIWNFTDHCFVHAIRFREMCNPRFIVVSPDDRHLIPNFYVVWNMVTGEIIHRPQNNLEYKVSVFNNKGDKALLICAKETGSLIVYDARQVLVMLDLTKADLVKSSTLSAASSRGPISSTSSAATTTATTTATAASVATESPTEDSFQLPAELAAINLSASGTAERRRRFNIPPIQIQHAFSTADGIDHGNAHDHSHASSIITASYDIFDHFGVREIVHACFAPDGNTVALLNNMKDIWLATTSSMEILQHIRLNDFAQQVYFTLDGRHIMATYSHIGLIHGFEVVQYYPSYPHHHQQNYPYQQYHQPFVSTPSTLNYSHNHTPYTSNTPYSSTTPYANSTPSSGIQGVLHPGIQAQPAAASLFTFPSPLSSTTSASSISFFPTSHPSLPPPPAVQQPPTTPAALPPLSVSPTLPSSLSAQFGVNIAPLVINHNNTTNTNTNTSTNSNTIAASPSPRSAISMSKASPRHQELYRKHPRILLTTQPTWELSLPDTTGGQPNTVQKILTLSCHYLMIITVSEELLVYDLFPDVDLSAAMAGVAASFDEDAILRMNSGGNNLSGSISAAVVEDDAASVSSTNAAVYTPTSSSHYSLSSVSTGSLSSLSLSQSFLNGAVSPMSLSRTASGSTPSASFAQFTASSPRSQRISSQQQQLQHHHHRTFPAFPLAPATTPTPSSTGGTLTPTNSGALSRAASCDGIVLLHNQHQQHQHPLPQQQQQQSPAGQPNKTHNIPLHPAATAASSAASSSTPMIGMQSAAAGVVLPAPLNARRSLTVGASTISHALLTSFSNESAASADTSATPSMSLVAGLDLQSSQPLSPPRIDVRDNPAAHSSLTLLPPSIHTAAGIAPDMSSHSMDEQNTPSSHEIHHHDHHHNQQQHAQQSSGPASLRPPPIIRPPLPHIHTMHTMHTMHTAGLAHPTGLTMTTNSSSNSLDEQQQQQQQFFTSYAHSLVPVPSLAWYHTAAGPGLVQLPVVVSSNSSNNSSSGLLASLVSPVLITRVPMLSRGELRAVTMSMQGDLLYCVTSGQAARIFGLESRGTTAGVGGGVGVGGGNKQDIGGLLKKLTDQDRELLRRRGDLLTFYRR